MPDDTLSRHSDSARRNRFDSASSPPSEDAAAAARRLFDQAAATLTLNGSPHLQALPLRYEPVPTHLIALGCTAYTSPPAGPGPIDDARPDAQRLDPHAVETQSGLYLLYRAAAAGTLAAQPAPLLRAIISRAAHEATRGPFARDLPKGPAALLQALAALAVPETLRLLDQHALASAQLPSPDAHVHPASVLAYRLTDQPSSLHLALACLYPGRPRTQRDRAAALLVAAADFDAATLDRDVPRAVLGASPTAVDAGRVASRLGSITRLRPVLAALGSGRRSSTHAPVVRCTLPCALAQAAVAPLGDAGPGLELE